jgi:hypothetical protein
VATPDPAILVSRGPRIWSPKYEEVIAADDTVAAVFTAALAFTDSGLVAASANAGCKKPPTRTATIAVA